MTLETVVHAFDEGHTAEELVSHFPALRLADVYAVISYYLKHRAAVSRYLQQQEGAAEEVWRRIESMTDYHFFRERLLAAFCFTISRCLVWLRGHPPYLPKRG